MGKRTVIPDNTTDFLLNAEAKRLNIKPLIFVVYTIQIEY